MSDYISRQAAEDAMTQSVCGDTWEVEKAMEAVRQLPAADVIPVRHARWERYSGITIRCSRCEHVIHDWRLSECKYCPNCGAKMDSEKKE